MQPATISPQTHSNTAGSASSSVIPSTTGFVRLQVVRSGLCVSSNNHHWSVFRVNRRRKLATGLCCLRRKEQPRSWCCPSAKKKKNPAVGPCAVKKKVCSWFVKKKNNEEVLWLDALQLMHVVLRVTKNKNLADFAATALQREDEETLASAGAGAGARGRKTCSCWCDLCAKKNQVAINMRFLDLGHQITISKWNERDKS